MGYKTIGNVIVGAGDTDYPDFCNGGITIEPGLYRYKLVDGAVVERTPEELAADAMPASEPTPTIEQRTAALETATQQQAATLNEVVTLLEAIV